MAYPLLQIPMIHRLGPPQTSQPLLAISQQKRSGLILCKSFHAEFAGPGAVVNSLVEQEYTAVIAIGAPELIEVTTHQERQNAYSRRIQWLRWLQKMAEHPDPVQRSEKLLSSFEEFFGRPLLAKLPDELLGLLIGVVPETIATVRSQHFFVDKSELLADEVDATSDIVVLDPRTFQVLKEVSLAEIIGSQILESAYQLPFSATVSSRKQT